MKYPDVGPWALVPGWLIRRLRGVTYGREALALYAEIALRADRRTQAWTMSRQDLADSLGASVKTIDRWTKVLVDVGAVEVDRNVRQDGSTGWNTYRVFVAHPSPEDLLTPDPEERQTCPEGASDLSPPRATSDGAELEPPIQNPETNAATRKARRAPETIAREEEARDVVRAWWEWHQAGHDGAPPTAQPFIAVVKVVERLLAAHDRKAVKYGLIEAARTSTISVGTVETAIRRQHGQHREPRMVRDEATPDLAPRSGWEKDQ